MLDDFQARLVVVLGEAGAALLMGRMGWGKRGELDAVGVGEFILVVVLMLLLLSLWFRISRISGVVVWVRRIGEGVIKLIHLSVRFLVLSRWRRFVCF